MKAHDDKEFFCRPEIVSQVLDTMAAGVFVTDAEGRIVCWNKGAERITGRSAEEMGGRVCDVFGGGCSFEEMVKSGGVTNAEREITTRDGRAIWVLRNARILRDAEGNLLGGVENFVDITSLKRAREEITLLRSELEDRSRFERLYGKSAVMQEVYQLIERVAASDASVLLQGESGTGKELVAHAIHIRSARSERAFVKVNCSALAEGVLESELFGHVKGAFTGAVSDREGRFEAADGGTLFLDEVGDLSPYIQLKLLRVLQEREFERVGETKPRKVDVRVIAATNKDLKSLVSEGRFREDLYYRLKVVLIELPPLRRRKNDLPLLVDHFIKRFNRETGKSIRGYTGAALAALMDYDWPGNVRELENSIEHAFVTCQADTIDIYNLPGELRVTNLRGMSEPLRRPEPEEPGDGEERARIVLALRRNAWNRTKTAAELGFSRTTLWKKMKRYGLYGD